MALNQHQVDTVEILAATEAVSKIVARVHCRSKFPTVGTLEAKISIALFGDRTEITCTMPHGSSPFLVRPIRSQTDRPRLHYVSSTILFRENK